MLSLAVGPRVLRAQACDVLSCQICSNLCRRYLRFDFARPYGPIARLAHTGNFTSPHDASSSRIERPDDCIARKSRMRRETPSPPCLVCSLFGGFFCFRLFNFACPTIHKEDSLHSFPTIFADTIAWCHAMCSGLRGAFSLLVSTVCAVPRLRILVSRLHVCAVRHARCTKPRGREYGRIAIQKYPNELHITVTL